MYNKGQISETEYNLAIKQIDGAKVVFNDYIKYYRKRIKTQRGSGISKRKQKGVNIFLMIQKKLLKKTRGNCW